jgi:hypothetical protein
MSLVRIDWNPDVRALRRFGALLALIALVLGLLLAHRHRPAAPFVLWIGVPAGLAAAALPGSVGRWVYKAWMGVAFVLGTVSSFVLLAAMFYLVLTPVALLLRARGRDALRLRGPRADSDWVPLETPDDAAAYERLY